MGCQGDAKGERKERNFYQTKELQETDTTLLEAILSPLNIFFCTQTYQNPNKGHFSQLKYEPSANLTNHQREIRQPSGCKAKEITLNSEIILELCKTKNQEPPLRVVVASHQPLPSAQHAVWQSRNPVCSPDKSCSCKMKIHETQSTFPGLPRRLVKNSTALQMSPRQF